MNNTEINDDIIARVGRNDSTITSLSANEDQFTDRMADSLGRALQGNNHVKKLEIRVGLLTETGNYISLLIAIEQSSTLKAINFAGDDSPTSGRVVDRFLNATSTCSSIRKVELRRLENLGTNPFLSLLRSHVSDLSINYCTFADTSQESYRDIAAGLRENVCLQRLALIDIADEVTTLLLNAIRSHPAIWHLKVEPPSYEGEGGIPDVLLVDIGHVLSSCSMLTALELRYFRFSAANSEPIVQGLLSSPSVNALEIFDTIFNRDATNMFVSLFQNSNPIRTLKVMQGNFFQDTSMGQVVSRILRSNNNTLANLEVANVRRDAKWILEALQNNATLKTLTFAHSLNNEDLASLHRNLPKLRGLKKLSFRIENPIRISAESLLQAFEGNGSLEEVKIIQEGFELFNAEALAKIRSFCRRNKKLPSFLAAPVDAVLPSDSSCYYSNDGGSHHEASSDPVMNLRLRPTVYAAAQKIEAGGNRMIFRDLIRLGDLIGGDGDESSEVPLPNGKSGKRKRSDAED